MRPEIAFGIVLRNLRKSKQLSQEKLALESDLDRTFISLLERGLRQPSLSSILDLSKTLGISSTEIMAMVEVMLSKDRV